MKKLRTLQGGYPRQQDYLLNLQNELMSLADSMFAKLGVDMVLSGCEVTDNGNGTVNIAAGIVYVSGEVVRFDGAANVASDGSKALVKDVAVTTDPKLFGDGTTKDVYTEVKAVVGDKVSGVQITIGTTLYTLATYIQDVVSSYAIKGEIKDIYDFDGTFLDNFDASGLGVTPRYSNWHLMNGNGPTPNGQGRVRITAGKIVSGAVEYTFIHGAADGEVKHANTVAEMPQHDHVTHAKGPFSGKYLNRGNNRYSEGGGIDAFGGGAIDNGVRTGDTGSGQAHNNMQPYIAVYTIIKIA